MQQIQSRCGDTGKHDRSSYKYSRYEIFTSANDFSDIIHEK
jgi:hypothetical protein